MHPNRLRSLTVRGGLVPFGTVGNRGSLSLRLAGRRVSRDPAREEQTSPPALVFAAAPGMHLIEFRDRLPGSCDGPRSTTVSQFG
jgi:hypothetical protein